MVLEDFSKITRDYFDNNLINIPRLSRRKMAELRNEMTEYLSSLDWDCPDFIDQGNQILMTRYVDGRRVNSSSLSLGVIYYDVTDSFWFQQYFEAKSAGTLSEFAVDTLPESPPDFLHFVYFSDDSYSGGVFTDLYKEFSYDTLPNLVFLDAVRRVLLFNLPEDWEDNRFI